LRRWSSSVGSRILFDTGTARERCQNTEALKVDLRTLDFCDFASTRRSYERPQPSFWAQSRGDGVHARRRSTECSAPDSPGHVLSTLPLAAPVHAVLRRGKPPERFVTDRRGPDAKFVWIKETTEISPDVWLVAVISDVPGYAGDARAIACDANAQGTGLVVRMFPSWHREHSCSVVVRSRIACTVFWWPTSRAEEGA